MRYLAFRRLSAKALAIHHFTSMASSGTPGNLSESHEIAVFYVQNDGRWLVKTG